MEIMIQLIWLEDERDDQPLIQAVRLAWRHNADYGVGGSIDLNGLADDVGIGAETFPKLVQQNDNVVFSGDTFFRKEVAAIAKRRAHHAIHARRCELAFKIFRLILGCKVEAAAGECIQILKDRVLAFPVEEVLRGNPVAASLNLRPHHDKLVGLGIGHGREQRGIDDGEDGGIRANAEGESQDGRGRKDGRLAQLAHCELQVSKNRLHQSLPSLQCAIPCAGPAWVRRPQHDARARLRPARA